MDGVEDDALLSPELLLDEELGEAVLPEDELSLPLLEEGLDEEELGEAVLLEEELSLGVLLMPLPEGAPASDPAEGLALVPAPDAPEELSPVDEAPALVLGLPLAPAPVPCAQAAVAKATMAAVTAALMSFRFIFSSSRVGMEMDCAAPNARTMP